MNLGKLSRKLRREAAASPQKAAILAVLVLAAGYSWAPLLFQGKKTVAVVDEAAALESIAVAQPATGTQRTKTAPVAWNQLLKWIENDERMKPSAKVGERDPFVSTAAAKPIAEEVKPAAVPVVPEVTPEQAGLKLSTTIIGSRRRIARINGQSYEAGTTFAVDGRPEVIFRVSEVERKSVTLERLGKKYQLLLPGKDDPAAGKNNKPSPGKHD